jgi:hypothetical protein
VDFIDDDLLWDDFGFDLWLRLISARKFAHQSMTTVVVESNSTNISIIKGATSARLVVITSVGRTIEVVLAAGVSAATTGAGEGRSLHLSMVSLAAKALQQSRSRLRSELIAAQSHTDGTTGDFEAIHLLKGFFGFFRLEESANSY